LRAIVKSKFDIDELVFGFMIKDRLGQPIFGTNTHHLGSVLSNVKKNQTINFLVNFDMNLGPGTYSVAVALHSGDKHLDNNYEWRDLALVFNVINFDKKYFIGSTWLKPTIKEE
jgi:lipopolysaccharide transport system ATP-binding protein